MNPLYKENSNAPSSIKFNNLQEGVIFFNI